MLKRKDSPAIKALKLNDIKEPVIEFLDNGIEVAFFNLGSQDLIHVELVFNNGLTQSDNVIIPTAVSELFGTASSSFNSGEIAEKLDFYGAFLETSINKDIASISIYSLTEHIDDVLVILFDALFNFEYPQNDIDIFLSNSLQKLKSELEKVEYVCLKTFNQQLFKNHPYGNVISFADFENELGIKFQEFKKADAQSIEENNGLLWAKKIFKTKPNRAISEEFRGKIKTIFHHLTKEELVDKIIANYISQSKSTGSEVIKKKK